MIRILKHSSRTCIPFRVFSDRFFLQRFSLNQAFGLTASIFVSNKKERKKKKKKKHAKKCRVRNRSVISFCSAIRNLQGLSKTTHKCLNTSAIGWITPISSFGSVCFSLLFFFLYFSFSKVIGFDIQDWRRLLSTTPNVGIMNKIIISNSQ